MSLDAFNPRQKQDTIALLEVLRDGGITTIDAAIKALSVKEAAVMSHNTETKRQCQCGRGVIRPVEPVGGLARIGCCKCQYSEVVA